MSEPRLIVEGLSKSFGGESVLDNVDLQLGQDETVSILGRSGSGKTTLLKILAGLETADEGTVRLDGEDLLGVPPQRRGVLYLYQEPLLFPHLDVNANLAFGLDLRRIDKRERAERIATMLTELDLEGHARKMPHQLSGGQRQRVSFGRALLVEPRLLLLDEPFGNLDTDTRGRMQDLFRRIAERHRMPALFITHDLKEAILMGDRVGHLTAGRLRIFTDRRELLDVPELGLRDEVHFWSEFLDD